MFFNSLFRNSNWQMERAFVFYEAFNLAGAVLLGYYAFSKDAYTNIVLNLVWGVVALYSLNNIIVRHQQKKKRNYRGQKQSLDVNALEFYYLKSYHNRYNKREWRNR
jgi:hypothetical protein